MTSNEMVVDVSQDWIMACDVQQRFMWDLGRPTGTVNYVAQVRYRELFPPWGVPLYRDGSRVSPWE